MCNIDQLADFAPGMILLPQSFYPAEQKSRPAERRLSISFSERLSASKSW